MPLIDDPSVTAPLLIPRGFQTLPGSDEETNPVKPPVVAPLAPSAADEFSWNGLKASWGIVAAGLRQSNTISSSLARAIDVHGVSNDLVDPNYSPWDDVKGTPYEQYWKGTFSYSNNSQYTTALKHSIDRQEQDRRTVDAGGALGTVSGILGGILDPTMLLPVGGEVTLAGKGIWTVGKGAAAGARAGLLGSTAYELGLHASQDTRTAEESAFTIGTGTVLGAVIGGTIAGALSRTQRVGSEAALEQIANMPVPDSLGAAASHKFTLDDMAIEGTVARNVAAGTAFSPNLRGNFRESPLARQTYQELATNVLRQQMHVEGESLGASVETNINVSLGETIGQALERHPEIYQLGKKAGFGMSSNAFDESVGRAMRRLDLGDNEFVSKAAQMWRKQVVDPLTQQAIEMKLLPEDVSVSEAPSYFSRMYNTERMVARKPEFVQIATDHFHEILQNQYAIQAEKLNTKISELKQEVDALQMKPKAREKLLKGNEELAGRLAGVEDPAAHILAVAEKQRVLTRKFYDTWEIKRLGEGVDLTKPENTPDFSTHAKDMAHEVYDSITGNDYGSASVDPQFHLAAKSGPLKERTFHIPDEKIEPFLQDNVVQVLSRFARSMSAQVELARKFPGDALLTERFKAIKNEYDILVNGATSEAARIKLQKDMKGTFRDLRALLEIHRGSYKAQENASSWGRVVRGLMNFNYIRSMGGSAIPSLSDIYGPAIFHGFTNTLDVGVPALLKAISKNGQLVKEGKYAGVAERLTHHRLLTMAEIGDPYGRGNAIERFLDAGTHTATKWNGLNMLTDFEKAFDGIVVQDRLNNALLKGKDDKFLAYSGMDSSMRSKVLKQLEQHVTEEDGIKVANTDQWDDFNAVRAYRAAINFNVNADIVTRGIGDVPLLAYTPTGKLLLQFKTFNLAAHQRTMLRATQLGPAQFLSGLIGLTTIGMFATYLKALRGGKENFERFQNSARNPGYLVGEGLDQTGFFTLPIELGNLAEKATAQGGYAFNPVKTPLMLAGKQFVPDASLQANSQRYAGKGVVSAELGPSAGLVEDLATASGIPIDAATGKEIPQSKLNSANRIIPYNSYLGMREMLQLIEGNSPYTDRR